MIKTARLFLFILLAGALVLSTGCRSDTKPPLVSSAGGDLLRDPAAARANTDRAYALIQSGKFADAQPVLQRAIEEDPSYGPAHNDLGLVYFQLDRFYDAAWELEKAAKLLPQSPEPPNNLGLVLEKAGKLPEAQTAFAQAHQLAPTNYEYAGNLARVRVRQNLNDAQTRALLEQLIFSDIRPEWSDWAKRSLLRLRPSTEDSQPNRAPISQPSSGN